MDSPSDGPRTPPEPGSLAPAVDDAITGVIPTVTVLGEEAVEPDPPRPVATVQSPAPPRPTIAGLKRERAGLLDRLDDAQYDLGGLAMEMVRREQFNAHLIERRAAEAVALERRIVEIDGIVLAIRDAEGDETLTTSELLAARRACERCHVLAPDANFCGYCGTARGAA